MRCGIADGPSENAWIQLGHMTKCIRDRIMDFSVISCNRFGKSSKMYKAFKTLDSSFLKVRSKLDDFVCGAYSMNQNTIGNGHAITGIFFGDRVTLSNYDHLPTYKRGELPRSFDQAQEHDLGLLFENVDALLTEINQHPYLVKRFKEKEAKAILKRFMKNVQAIKQE